MPCYDVSVVVDGVDLTDDIVDRLFDRLPDAVPAQIAGTVTVQAPVDAPTAEAAAFRLVDDLAVALPTGVVVRLDQDLVSIPDIAERTGRSRESVRLLVEGRRGPGGFPASVGTVGDGIRVWPWPVVADWFVRELGDDVGPPGVPPEVAAVVDACLAARRRRYSHRRQVAWAAPASSAGAYRLRVAGPA